MPTATPDHDHHEQDVKRPKPQVQEQGLQGVDGLTQTSVDPSVALQHAKAAPARAVSPSDILSLQRAAGNRAVQRLIAQLRQTGTSSKPTVQPELTVNPPGVVQQEYGTQAGEISVDQVGDAREKQATGVRRAVSDEPAQSTFAQPRVSLNPPALQRNAWSKLWKSVKQFFGHKINPKEAKKVLEGVFKGREINTAGVTFQDGATFESGYDKKYGEGEYAKDGPLEGYRDPETNEVFVNKDEWVIDTAVHEILHNNSNPAVKTQMGVNFNEGITEYLTQKAVAEVGYSPSSSYPGELAVVQKLAGTVGDGPIEKAYFDGDVDGLKTKLDTAKGDDTTFDKAVEAMKDDDYATASALVG